ncbi:MAG: 30S ribosomal protein S8 [Candidatus Omnitrophica bacterium]|jgi:small subunit ribosomal protein S8|nr:30S ribosomal protein S8 [Candidatus Omnitrophota bacterium]
MSISDPIANALTNIRNAVHARKETLDIPASNLTGKLLEIFKSDGYIEDFRLMKNTNQGTFKIYLKYINKASAIIGLKRISRPGLRVYVDKTKVPHVLNGLGTAVISTSKGVLSDREARKLNIGGELVCYIW